ncbi:hypothetical protein AX16_010903 [Volvariella volvacea WC 439]|nr:hypothetical protein AX16_010903 [Volvariella volvacea WC 439]
MRATVIASLLFLCQVVYAGFGGVDEIANPPTAARVASGQVHMGLMSAKEDTFARQRASGAYISSQYPPVKKFTRCQNGYAAGYRCSNIDLYSFTPHSDLGSAVGEGSSSWGWTAPGGREIMIVGQADGAAFAEINKDGSVTYLGRLPRQSVDSIWREIRVFKHYAVIGSEALDHYVQIFDLRKLLKIRPGRPVTFDTSEAVLFRGLPIGRTHNIVVNEERDYAVAVGAQPRNSTCAAGLIFIDLKNPNKPTSPGCASGDGYVHDAQCIVYRGPHREFRGRDICYGYNEDTLTIYDVTNKNTTNIISRTSYTGASYTHQGWVLDPNNQEFLLLDDELDEINAAGPAADGFPVTYIWDIRNLRAPVLTGYYKSPQKSIDHNQYVADGKVYQSNYAAGLRVLDVSSIPRDPTGGSVREIGWFDVYPEDDETEGLVDFAGTWSSYALFKSGYIAINSIERGLFVVKLQNQRGPGGPGGPRPGGPHNH